MGCGLLRQTHLSGESFLKRDFVWWELLADESLQNTQVKVDNLEMVPHYDHLKQGQLWSTNLGGNMSQISSSQIPNLIFWGEEGGLLYL